MEKTVNQRFTEVVDYLLDTKTVPSKKQLAADLGVSPSYFTEILKERLKIGADTLQKFFTLYPSYMPYIFGLSESILTRTPIHNVSFTEPQHVYNTQSAPPTKRKSAPATAPANHNLGHPRVVTVTEKNEEIISLVNVKAAAGYLNGYADPEYIESLPTMRVPGLKSSTHRAFQSKGHSMSPTIHDNATLIGSWVESLNDIRDRRIYIIVTKDYGITVKRVLNRISDSGQLVLISDNHNKIDYPNFTVRAEDIKEVWYLTAALIYEFREPGELYTRFNDLEATVTLLANQVKKLTQ